MPRAPTLMIVAFPLLTACFGSGGGGLRIDPLPAEALRPCPAPSALLGAGDWEIIAGRIGDALIDCEGRRALAVAGYDGLRRSAGAQ
jgi:hypothetical protein